MLNQNAFGHYLYSWDMLEVKGSRDKLTVRSTCPRCRDERTHGREACASFNTRTGFGRCFKCGATFWPIEREQEFQRALEERRQRRYKRPETAQLTAIVSKPVVDYVTSRGLSVATMSRAGVMEQRVTGADGKTRYRLAFRFLKGTEVVDVQYKSLDKQFAFSPGCEKIFWNYNAIFGADTLYITEGMMDALALMEAGVDNVVSVPNGAGSGTVFLKSMSKELEGIGHFIFAGDTDESGIRLRNDIMKVLGEARCSYVVWKTDDGSEYKDANEVLMNAGKEALLSCLKNELTRPISGLVRLSDVEDQLNRYLEDGVPQGVAVEVKGISKMVRFEPGRFYVCTGYPGSGKSTFIDFILLKIATVNRWKMAMFSPEKYPTERHYAELITCLTARTFAKDKISSMQYIRAKRWIDNNVFHIDGEHTAIEEILRTAEQLAMREHIRLLALDPFNTIDLPILSGANDTQKISWVLREIVRFAHRYAVAVVLVAHPRKGTPDMRTGKLPRLTLSDISGSMEFYNKCDVGFIINRDTENQLSWLDVQKVRFDTLGQLGKVAMKYDRDIRRFVGCRLENAYNGLSPEPQQVPYDMDRKDMIDAAVKQESFLNEELRIKNEEYSCKPKVRANEDDECPF